jgi:hypothetical protein
MSEVSAALQEEYLTTLDIAKILKLDAHTIRDLFRNEPGVIVLGRTETTSAKRKYASLRIPVAVYRRVVTRLANKRTR